MSGRDKEPKRCVGSSDSTSYDQERQCHINTFNSITFHASDIIFIYYTPFSRLEHQSHACNNALSPPYSFLHPLRTLAKASRWIEMMLRGFRDPIAPRHISESDKASSKITDQSSNCIGEWRLGKSWRSRTYTKASYHASRESRFQNPYGLLAPSFPYLDNEDHNFFFGRY